MSRAYKFLGAGAVGLFSGFAWPLPRGGAPGEWVDSGHAPALCVTGVHACRPADLIDWIDEELWVVELDGAIAEERVLVAERGRLLERVAAWDGTAADALAHDVAERARERVAAVPPAPPGGDPVLDLAVDIDWLARGGRPDAVPPRATGQPAPAAIAANVCFVAAHHAGLAAAGGDPTDDRYAAGFAEERAHQRRWLLDRVGL